MQTCCGPFMRYRCASSCLVTDNRRKQTDDIIMAYQGKKKDESYLVSELQKYVTDYMMPTVFVRYREFPYNANGKIDRRFISENINK